MSLHINWTRYSEVKAGRIKCPTCRPFTTAAVARFQEWYGWRVTCLRCGENWSDGEMCKRPCERGWRDRSITAAKGVYRAHHPKPARVV